MASYKCDVCSKSFIQSGHLTKHKRCNTGENPGMASHKCEACAAFLPTWAENCIHDFKCDICTKAFRRSPHLSTHNMTHTGEKPYNCYVCRQIFCQLSNLYTHMRNFTSVMSVQSLSFNLVTWLNTEGVTQGRSQGWPPINVKPVQLFYLHGQKIAFMAIFFIDYIVESWKKNIQLQ
jgi:hypothetical protein